MKERLSVLLVLLFISATAGAQQFGGFPPSTKWRQIRTDTVRLIFEAQVDSQAQTIVAIIHRANRVSVNPLGNKVRPINILLHRNTTLANGYVALGPFRSEFYLVPGSDIFEFSSLPWAQSLAVHEYRHVHQVSNFRTGVSRVAAFLFGQEGQAAFNDLSIPNWFYEGDAVHSETIETTQGRGRAPAFFNGFRALWHEGRDYSWAKLRNGSLKDFVPNHYPLGYMLVNYGYQTYGADFWRKVTADALSFRGFFGFFGGSIRRFSGKTFPEFRREALASYQHEVSTRRDAVAKRETVTDYLFPQQVGADSLVYLKRSYRSLPAFYLRDAAGEHRIKLRHISFEDWFRYRNGLIAYTAFSTSARWALLNYSDVILLNTTTGEEKRLTQKGKYYTPDISPAGDKVLAVAFTDSLTSELHLLSLAGRVEQRVKAPANALFVHPHFLTDDEYVVALREANGTMSLQKGSLKTGTLTALLPPIAATIGYPATRGNTLYFVSSQAGNDEVYELDLAASTPQQTVRQLTFGQAGSYFPNVRADTLVWSQFTSNGYRVQKRSLKNIRELPVADMRQRLLPFRVALQDAPNVLATPGRRFPTAPYKKTTGLFNFHSWRPAYADPEITYSLYSDNVLNTFSHELFYRYNINETSHAVGFNSFFGGWFPVLNAGVSYTFDRTIKTTRLTYDLNQWEARAGYSIPLNFSRGKTYKFLSFGSNFVYNQLTPTDAYKSIVRGRTATYLHHFVSWSQQLPRAVQHIYPRFAYAVNLQHRHLLDRAGYQALGGAALYLPSVRNHSVVLAANLQQTDTANITFSNRFANSRGYNDFYFRRMWRVSGNYHMPLLYPDQGISGIIYLLRVRSNFFYDYTRVTDSRNASATQRSVGGELFLDTKLFNTLPASIGFRLSHLLDPDFSGTRPKGSNIFEVVLPLDLIPQ